MVYKGKSIYKWMRTGGTPISGNLHMMYHIFGWISRPHVPQKTGHWDGNWMGIGFEETSPPWPYDKVISGW